MTITTSTNLIPTLSWQLSKTQLRPSSAVWARLRITAPATAASTTAQEARKGFACAFSVDCSGSMALPAGVNDQGTSFNFQSQIDPSNTRMERAKKALLEAIDALTDQDMASVTAFSSQAITLFPLTRMSSDAKDKMRECVLKLAASGGTALHDGWTEAGKEAAKGLHHNLVCRVILMTDGDATNGERNPEVLAKQSADLATLGISTSCFGVGAQFNEDLLCGMAESGEGNFRYIPDAILASAAVMDELSGLSSQTGRRVRLSLSALPGVTQIKDLNELTQDPLDQSLVLTNLISGRSIDVLVELTLDEHFRGEAQFKATLSWEDRSQTRQSMDLIGSVELVEDDASESMNEDQEVLGLKASLIAAQEKKTMVAAMTRGDMAAASASMLKARSALSGTSMAYSGFARENAMMDQLEGTMLSGDLGATRKAAVWQNYSATKNQGIDSINTTANTEDPAP